MALVEPKKVAGGAFGQFLAEKRSELQKELQGKPVTEITKLASAKFKALSEEERAIYQEKYLTAKAKYEADLKAFEEAGGEKKQRKAKGKKDGKKTKDPDAPKRPGGGAYGCFLAKHRAAFQKETAGQPVTAVTKLASAKWSALSADEKKIYEDEYKAKKEAYDEAMKSYVPREGAEEPAVKKPRLEAKEAKVMDKEPKAKAAADGPKRARGRPRADGAAKAVKAKAPKGEEVELQATVLAKAEKVGMSEALRKLANREDIKASGKSQSAMLKALEENRGLVHPAKRALLGDGNREESAAMRGECHGELEIRWERLPTEMALATMTETCSCGTADADEDMHKEDCKARTRGEMLRLLGAVRKSNTLVRLADMEPMFQILGLNRLFCNKPPRETSALDPGFVIYRGVGGVNTPSGVFGDHSNMVPHAWKGVSVSLTSHDFLQQQEGFKPNTVPEGGTTIFPRLWVRITCSSWSHREKRPSKSTAGHSRHSGPLGSQIPDTSSWESVPTHLMGIAPVNEEPHSKQPPTLKTMQSQDDWEIGRTKTLRPSNAGCFPDLINNEKIEHKVPRR
ncbi:FACT complex subunit SSRP1 (Facilitates chromatin transcription complex subunit SSRP1) (Structure-specific recognition protein 1) [Durusdinium trenchii]|uniref:FACT complex subunit SSRP1 (Facilitates chromatin transcription complex subunit SSRP1) (Structure-specific recognition protein 1) n=1 Tax=Durusdinium trenchii TaxID=1381693 RepID=A0ABP0Q002_9DINO